MEIATLKLKFREKGVFALNSIGYSTFDKLLKEENLTPRENVFLLNLCRNKAKNVVRYIL